MEIHQRRESPDSQGPSPLQDHGPLENPLNVYRVMGGGSERWDKASLVYPRDPGQGWTRPSLLTIFSSLLPLAILKLGVLGTCSLELSEPIFRASPAGSQHKREMTNRTAVAALSHLVIGAWDLLVWVELMYLSCWPLQGA